MSATEDALRTELRGLAALPQGRDLLQLALRGLSGDGRGLTAGCWVKGGVAGCLFQHAYWQGVREGVFRDEGRPGDWIGSLVGSRGHATVLNAIGAFDRLAKRHHADRTPRRILPDKVEIRTGEWRQVVERMLVETLADSPVATPARNPVPA